METDTLAKKSLGQYWLNDEAALAAICSAANLMPEDTVLEIGPGLGSLTKLLTSRVNKVIAVELDENLAESLASRVKADNLEVISEDILKFDLTQLPIGYKVVANIPYYLTSNLIRVLSESTNPPTVAVLLVQKEVAERLAAGPGNLSILAVTAQYYWQIELKRVVAAQLFSPPPKVDSQIVVMTKRNQPLFPNIDPKQFFRLVKAGFSQKRKAILNSLSGGLAIDRATVRARLEAAKIAPTARAQTLSLEDWYQLYQALVKA